MKSVAKINRVSEQEIEIMIKNLAQESQIEKTRILKWLAIDEITVIKRKKSYYMIIVDLDKRVS